VLCSQVSHLRYRQRQHSVRPIIEKLKNTFAMKFENPVVERTSDSITNEVTNNWQVLRTLTKSTAPLTQTSRTIC
jgi:hypothetical protein